MIEYLNAIILVGFITIILAAMGGFFLLLNPKKITPPSLSIFDKRYVSDYCLFIISVVLIFSPVYVF